LTSLYLFRNIAKLVVVILRYIAASIGVLCRPVDDIIAMEIIESFEKLPH
jgi:hypothetical protein